MGLWDRLAGLMLHLIDEYDDQALFLWLCIEETGFPLPLPGDLAMLLAGTRVAQGKMNLIWALFLLEAATLLGGSALYWLGARGGRPLLHRYGRYVRLDRAKLDRAEAWIGRRQFVAVALGRVTPGLRNVTVLAAGVFGVPYRTFLPAFALGSFAYIAVFFGLGMWAGPQALEAIGAGRVSLRLAVTVVAFLGLSAFLAVMYRRAGPVRRLAREAPTEPIRLETSLMAGLLATLEMGMGLNVLLYLLGALGVGPPERVLLGFLDQAAARYAGGSSVRFLALLLAFTFVGGLGWAVVYSHVAVPLLRTVPPWLRGLAFSALPSAVSLLVVMPAVGAGFLGLGLGAGWLPLAGEVLRNALFGLGLAVSYSLLRVARQRPVRAAAAD
ncbi:MAG: DedA family protein [Chloroflexota bacterium]|nr:DedA family protein [Chloroflexota bacterium]